MSSISTATATSRFAQGGAVSGDNKAFADLLSADLAGTYPRTESAGQSVDPVVAEADLAAVQRDGFVILPDLLSGEQLAQIRAAVTPLLDHHGRNL